MILGHWWNIVKQEPRYCHLKQAWLHKPKCKTIKFTAYLSKYEMLAQRWFTVVPTSPVCVYDAGPTVNQRCANVSYFLGFLFFLNARKLYFGTVWSLSNKLCLTNYVLKASQRQISSHSFLVLTTLLCKMIFFYFTRFILNDMEVF